MATVTLTYTGAAQTWAVPNNAVSPIQVECWGGQGGRATGNTGTEWYGGYAKGSLAVTPGGETLNVYVGGQGVQPTAGWNGGGAGQYNAGGDGWGGGGGTDIRQGGTALANRKIVAGGGGGQSGKSTRGGAGGNTTGTAGANVAYSGSGTAYGGGPGTQTAGGAGGAGVGGAPSGNAGSLGQGANGTAGTYSQDVGSGAGGGGYYGGGSGGAIHFTDSSGFVNKHAAGGGGGSGYIGGVTSGTMTTAVRAGNGQVIFTYSENTAPNAPTLGSPADAATVGNASDITFSWTHSDPNGDAQDGFSIRRSTDAGATWEYWTGSAWSGTASWVTSSTQSVAIPGGTFADGQTYTWTVATRDPHGATGPYATPFTLTISDEPPGAPILLSPSDGSTVSDATPVLFDWDLNDPGDVQSAYVLRRKRRP